MRYFILTILVLVVVLYACKSSVGVQTTPEEKSISTKNPWERIDFKPAKDQVLPNAYSTYLLDVELFNEQLKSGEVQLPMPNGEFYVYQTKNSATMSPELQEKFPNIKSYVGNSNENALCQARIDQKDMTFKISLLCNDATLYIQELYNEGIYFIYKKSDLPNGVGTIKE